MIVAKLQQKVNLKASSNIVLVPQHWSFKRKYLQDKSGIGKLAWKLPDFIKRDGTMKVRRSLRESKDKESQDEETNST
ncbi:splicing factor 3B subunit 2 [Trichonephila inaurata madagascariensis]|uniref:Splicing factor 3B subunit 2 n=1 Tax=Trichonephila inaurata madagascariensis TaxID=2747483 RepID=A0A8X6ME73_9ARAC|nr:splicing factor 3B subunit 2 [Trichonephila inaurata madagascariensis]